MYADIKKILKILKKNFFTGHVKIGVEHGKIVSCTRTFNALKNEMKVNLDFDTLLKSLDDELQFGSVEYDLEFGKIINLVAYDIKNGDELKKWLSESAVVVTVVKNPVELKNGL